MADKTGIEWTDSTWNPVVGCDRVSPGCDNCYAIGQSARIVAMAEATGKATPYEGTVVQIGPPKGDTRLDWSGVVKTVDERLDQPIRWRRPRRIFVNSMSDLFHPDVPADFIWRVFAVMRLAPQHQFQILTKRPQRMSSLLGEATTYGAIWRTARELAGGVDASSPLARVDVDAAFHPDRQGVWPFPNVWLGTSIEADRYTFRARALAATPAAVRFVSAEPLLGPLPSLDLTNIDWVIVGGESGPNARPMHPDWARHLRDRCVDEDVAYLFKQWGEWVDTDQSPVRNYKETSSRYRYQATRFAPDGFVYHADQRKWETADDYNYPGMTTMLRVGKKTAGRTLDGRTWDQYPA